VIEGESTVSVKQMNRLVGDATRPFCWRAQRGSQPEGRSVVRAQYGQRGDSGDS